MIDELIIRSFEDKDKSAVIELWETVFPNDPPWNIPADVIERKLSMQGELFFVCLIQEELAGTVLAGFDGVRGWVHKLAVSPKHQRLGIASRLMEVAEQRLLGLGCPKLNLQIRASNVEVIDFYSQAGYSIEDRVSMGKKLES